MNQKKFGYICLNKSPQQLVNGIILGSIYALLSVLIYHGLWDYQID